jgi:hypothetical protein
MRCAVLHPHPEHTMRLTRLLFAAILPLAACEDFAGLGTDPDAPANVTYQLSPSGNPSSPAGVLLTWDVPTSGRANSFNVYGRSPANGQWNLRATTTSQTFHDAGANWTVEGTTVTDAFLAGNLVNGVARCFAVSAISRTGHESTWSEARLDTPRYDAKNAFVYSTAFRRDSSGFIFFDDVTRKYGVVGASTRTDLDFTIERHSDGSLWFAPARAAVTMALYSTQPVTELTSIDRAPATGFAGVTIEALPGYAYVFRIVRADGVHHAAIRVAFSTPDYIVFDWAYQSAPGSVELSRAPAN